MQVEGSPRIYAIADEDLERATPEKTASVHFLRFELEPAMIAALRSGAAIAAGVDHPSYNETVRALAPAVTASLIEDLSA